MNKKMIVGTVIAVIAIAMVAVPLLIPHHVVVTYEGEGSVDPCGEMDIAVLSPMTIAVSPGEHCGATVYVNGQEVGYSEEAFEYALNTQIFDFSTMQVLVVFSNLDRYYTLDVSHGAGGTTDPVGKVDVPMDTVKEVVATPDATHEVASYSIDGITYPYEGKIEVLMDGNHSVYVSFGELSIVSIEIAKNPTKTSYAAGERFNPAGMEVVVKFKDGTQKVLSKDEYVITPSGPLKTSDTKVTISYMGFSQEVRIYVSESPGPGPGPGPEPTTKTLTSITIDTNPTKTTYAVGEAISKDGMVVIAHFSDSTTSDVTNSCTLSPTPFTEIGDNQTVTVSYTYGGTTKTATFTVNVTDKVLDYITATLKSVEYHAGALLADIVDVVTAHYVGGTSEPVTGWTTDKTKFMDKGDGLEFTISYMLGTITKTVTKTVDVKEGTGFSVTVTKYDGMTKNVALKDFTPNLNPMNPGAEHTMELVITNTSGFDLDACLCLNLKEGSDEDLAKSIFVTVKKETATLGSYSVYNLSGMEGINLGIVSNGTPATIDVTITFSSIADNTLMDKSIGFELGVFAGEVTA